MANMFYYLGDFASKPMQWDWMNTDSLFIERLCGVNYQIYNWLMLKSVYFNDEGGCDVWIENNDADDDLDEDEDRFEPMIFQKSPENDKNKL